MYDPFFQLGCALLSRDKSSAWILSSNDVCVYDSQRERVKNPLPMIQEYLQTSDPVSILSFVRVLPSGQRVEGYVHVARGSDALFTPVPLEATTTADYDFIIGGQKFKAPEVSLEKGKFGESQRTFAPLRPAYRHRFESYDSDLKCYYFRGPGVMKYGTDLRNLMEVYLSSPATPPQACVVHGQNLLDHNGHPLTLDTQVDLAKILAHGALPECHSTITAPETPYNAQKLAIKDGQLIYSDGNAVSKFDYMLALLSSFVEFGCAIPSRALFNLETSDSDHIGPLRFGDGPYSAVVGDNGFSFQNFYYGDGGQDKEVHFAL